MTKKILLVEDDITLGDLIVLALSRHDYAVTWFVRARMEKAVAKQDDKIVFMNDRGVETSFNAVQLQEAAQSYEFALVDYRLKGSVMEGIEVTRTLSRQGITVIACSGLPYLNDQMIEAGAVAGIEKHEIFTRSRLLTGDNMMQSLTQSNTKVQKRL